LPEIIDEALKIAQSSKQAMQQHKRLTFAFFNKPEFVVLFYFVAHVLRCKLIFAKIIVLLQNC
jgi:hypothetical protein